MKEIFKQLIIDFHNVQIPKPSLRVLNLPQLPPNIRKAYVFVGMRRSGKTWALYQQMQSLMKNGIKFEQILYINFADDRLLNLESDQLKFILDTYFELYPQYLDEPKVHFFFDEIHEVPKWENFIRRLLDTEKMTIYVTGSSAKMLSKEIATSLRGRVIVREIFPFGFYEYLHYHKLEPKKPKAILSSKQKITIKHYAQNFLRRGGFPEITALFAYSTFPMVLPFRLAASSDMLDTEFCELLQSYIESVIYRDIVDRYQITNSHAVKRLLVYCLQNTAKRFSVNKLYKDWKSQGYKVSKDSLYKFMEYFEDAYCVFSVPVYSFSSRKSANLPKKIYSVDQGLITAYTIKDTFELSSRLEATVFSHLRRNNNKIYYFNTKSGKEVDFLILNTIGQINLYQVALSISDKDTAARELDALQQAMVELNIKTATIVTLDEEQQIKISNRKINCLPVWKFLLS